MSETEIKVPNIGDFKDVEVIEVLVVEGQSIKKNDPLITIESDKSSVEIPSNLEGKIKIPAAWMIDTLGLKGFRSGDAGVHCVDDLLWTCISHGLTESVCCIGRFCSRSSRCHITSNRMGPAQFRSISYCLRRLVLCLSWPAHRPAICDG